MLLDWLTNVFHNGMSVQESQPSLSREERPAVEDFLNKHFELYALDIAGPPIPFDAASAVESAELLAKACWLLVSGEKHSVNLVSRNPSSSPSCHLSANLLLRFLPGVYRRSKEHHPEGKLTLELERLLRLWPLSGVLANLDGSPSTQPEFGGHSGLQMLYTERLMESGQPGWVPQDITARMWVERVFREHGKAVPVFIPEEENVRA